MMKICFIFFFATSFVFCMEKNKQSKKDKMPTWVHVQLKIYESPLKIDTSYFRKKINDKIYIKSCSFRARTGISLLKKYKNKKKKISFSDKLLALTKKDDPPEKTIFLSYPIIKRWLEIRDALLVIDSDSSYSAFVDSEDDFCEYLRIKSDD